MAHYPAGILIFLSLLLMPVITRARVVESFDLDTYEVDQDDGQTLLQAINRHSPIRERGRVFHGYTRWFIRWNFRWWEAADGTCRITEVTTKLDVDMTLPALDDATPAARAQFRKYLTDLRLHEDGHVSIAREAAHRIDGEIFRLPAMPSCDALAQRANQRGQAILGETRQVERQYDVETNHGCTQGACL